jgi:uncharacterized protein with FMN-binding domain
MKKRTKVLLVILAVIIVLAAVAALLMSRVGKNLSALNDISIEDLDFSDIADGSYTGHYKCFPVEAEVCVTVAGGRIADIELIKHVNGQGRPAESIVGTVAQKQTLQVDTVTGATYSSKVILLAIEEALKKAS